MPRKLNRKFIVIVGGVTLTAVVGVGGVAAWRMSSAPERNIALGDAALRAGKVNEAVDRYGRAANKRPDRTDFWKKYVEALELQSTNTTQAAAQSYFQLLGGRAKLAESDPADVSLLKSYLDMLAGTNPADVALACARIKPAFANHPEQTSMIEVLATTAALRQWESKRAGIDDAERKLLDLARAPGSGEEPWIGLVEYASARLDAARRAGLSTDVARWGELLDGYLAQGVAANPESLRLAIAVSLKAMSTDRDLRRPQAEAQAPVAVRAMLELGARTVDGLDAIDVVNVLKIAPMFGDVERNKAVEIAQDWLEKHAGDPMVNFELAGVLQTSTVAADRQEAIALFTKVRDLQAFPQGPAALSQDAMRVRAAQGIFDSDFVELIEADDAAAREKLLPRLDASIQAMRRVAGAGNDETIGRCEALLLFGRGQYGPALRGLERTASSSDSDTLAMLVAIECALRREEFGVAQQLAARAAAKFPQNAKILEGALRVTNATGRRNEARALAERLKQLDPSNDLATSVLGASMDPAGLAPALDELEAALRKAFQESKGDPMALRDAAVVLIAANPGDVRPRLMWVEAIARTGDREAALKATEESLALFPDNAILKARKLDLSTTDPVQRLRQAASMRPGTETERLVFEASTLLASEPAFERAVIGSADASERERITGELASIRRGIDEVLPKALAASPGNETLLILMAERGARRKDPAMVDEAVKAAGAAGDPKMAAVILAVAALRNGDANKVVELIKADAEALTGDALRLRLLGEAYLALGNPDKAVTLLARAFERQPTNSAIGRLYADALLATGESKRALALLAEAAAANPDEGDLLNQWLAAEARIGDRSRALVERRIRLRKAPDDLANMRGLAALLLEASPDQTNILDDQFRPRYSQAQWEGMQLANRQDVIRRAREANVVEAKALLQSVRKADPNDLDAVSVEMQGLSALGDIAGAEAVLESAASTVTRNRPLLFLMQADFLYRISKPEQAEKALARALEASQGDTATIRAVARLRASRGEIEAALKAVEPLLAQQPSNDDLREAARWNLVIRQADAAKALLARVQDGTDRREQFATKLVLGMSAVQDMIGRQEAGDRAGMDASFAAVQKVLGEAAQLDPRSPLPHVSLAEISMQMYRRTGDKAYLDTCLKALEPAQALDQLSTSIARLRWMALEAKGDKEGAVREARRILSALPKDAGVRMDLVNLYLRTGDPASARTVLEEAVQQSALNAVWLRRLAEIQSEARQWTEAGQSYERAFGSDRAIGSLELAAGMYLTKDPPDLRSLSGLIRAYPEQVRQSLYLQSARSAGESLSGAREAGLVNLRSIYQANQAAGAARQPLQGWFDILLLVFKVSESKSELEAYDAFVRQVADMKDPETLRQLAAAWTLPKNAPPDVLAKAKEYAQSALAASGDDRTLLAMGHMTLGNVLYRAGDCKGATEEFGKVLEAFPNQFDAINNLAYVEASCGDATRALEFARRATALDPTNVDGIDTLGLAQLKSGDVVGAEMTLLRGLDLRQTPTLLLHLAMAQDAQGRKDAAKASLASAMSLAKDSPLAESEAAAASALEAKLK
ncbi:MAG: tetratricopeptide repeat protein [Bacteroidia bacterium]|nr:tetratricopeptide repeat protein [Bacteroidia bacterium]